MAVLLRLPHQGDAAAGWAFAATALCGAMALGFLAAHTSSVELQLLMTGVTYRHPGLLAKIVSTLDVLSGGLAASRVLEIVGPRLATKDYTPTGPAKFMHKDLSFVVESARNVGAAAPMASAGRELYAQLLTQGLGDLDLAVVRQTIANLSTTSASHSGTETAKETAP